MFKFNLCYSSYIANKKLNNRTSYQITFIKGALSATREFTFVPRVCDKVTLRTYGDDFRTCKSMVTSVEVDYAYDEREIFTVVLEN